MTNEKQQAEDIDWSKVTEDMAKLILERGETYLKAQLEISLASDRRALTVASVFATFGTGVIGAAIAYFDQKQSWPILLPGLTAGACILIGAAYAFWSARPIDFYGPGNHPKEWWPVRRRKLTAAIGGESQNTQERIEHNERCLASNAQALAVGSRWAIAAPIVGFIVWCTTVWAL